ncbi:GIY-YIG nuclease family protein [Candidatus Cloacimonadota bacterium]
MKKSYYVYIVTNKRNGTLYIGVTSDLLRRINEHKNKLVPGFTSKYNLTKLVYYEEADDVTIAIKREKQMKKWNRKWKIELIEKENLEWNDLAKNWYD